MKNIIFVITVSIFVLSSVVLSQSRFTPKERLINLQNKLNLTDEQSSKIEKILIDSDQQMKNLRAGENPSREEIRKVRENTNQEIMKLLDDNQKAVYNKILEQRKSNWQRKPDNKNQKPN